jgi:hypothetical protein
MTALESHLDLTLSIFLLLCACICFVCFLVELCGTRARHENWYAWTSSKLNKQTLSRLIRLSFYAWSICLLLGITQLALRPDQPVMEFECAGVLTVNPDIGGIGVRIGLEVAMGWTLASLLLGALGYRGETGTKELGATLFVSTYAFASPFLCSMLARHHFRGGYTITATLCFAWSR